MVEVVFSNVSVIVIHLFVNLTVSCFIEYINLTMLVSVSISVF